MTEADASTRFGRDGYLVMRGALPTEICTTFAAATMSEMERLIAAGWTFTGAGRLAGHLNIRMGESGRPLYAAFCAAGLPQLVARLAGEPVALVQAVGNLNLPGSSAQELHIDGDFGDRVYIANVCVVPTTADNGATALLPASDRTAMSYWRMTRDHWRASSVRPELAPGDVVIRPSNLWHGGTPNRSGTARPMAAFVFAPVRTAPPACHDLDGPLTIFGNKFYGRWRRWKEFAAVRLPLVDDAARLCGALARDLTRR